MSALLDLSTPSRLAQRRVYKGFRANCRATLYSFFAQVLSPPNDALVSDLCDGSLRKTVARAVLGAPKPHRDLLDKTLLADLACACGEAAARNLLLVEYTRLWGTDLICPHYETDYIYGDSFRSVHVNFRRIGLLCHIRRASSRQCQGTARLHRDRAGVHELLGDQASACDREGRWSTWPIMPASSGEVLRGSSRPMGQQVR